MILSVSLPGSGSVLLSTPLPRHGWAAFAAALVDDAAYRLGVSPLSLDFAVKRGRV